MKRTDRGFFTMIEFAVVVVILAILVAVVAFAIGGLSDDEPARDPVTGHTYPETRVEIVTDWTGSSGSNRYEREITVNGRPCIESMGYSNYGSGIDCDWSAQ